jgi:hypothetical protein
MPTKLRHNEPCPLHHGSRTCCGRVRERAQFRKEGHGIFQQVRPGVWRSPDGREKCAKSELRKRKHKLLRENPVCVACNVQFTDYSEVELSHIESCGIGGAFRDDSMKNLVLMHADENREQGSRSLADYLADPKRIGLKRQ